MTLHVPGYEARWTAWVARYAEEDRRSRQRVLVAVPVLAVAALVAAIMLL